jgi:cytochrome c2
VTQNLPSNGHWLYAAGQRKQQMKIPTAMVCSLTLVCAAGARAGDVEKGKALFEKCAACHSLEAGHDDDGPNVAGIVSREQATASASANQMLRNSVPRRAGL